MHIKKNDCIIISYIFQHLIFGAYAVVYPVVFKKSSIIYVFSPQLECQSNRATRLSARDRLSSNQEMNTVKC